MGYCRYLDIVDVSSRLQIRVENWRKELHGSLRYENGSQKFCDLRRVITYEKLSCLHHVFFEEAILEGQSHCN